MIRSAATRAPQRLPAAGPSSIAARRPVDTSTGVRGGGLVGAPEYHPPVDSREVRVRRQRRSEGGFQLRANNGRLPIADLKRELQRPGVRMASDSIEPTTCVRRPASISDSVFDTSIQACSHHPVPTAPYGDDVQDSVGVQNLPRSEAQPPGLHIEVAFYNWAARHQRHSSRSHEGAKNRWPAVKPPPTTTMCSPSRDGIFRKSIVEECWIELYRVT